jgi:ABC-2 type transport system permease protein
MKQFLSFVKKEFYHIFRDKRTMLILLGMPVVQIILFGFAISTEIKNARIAVFDPSKDEATRQITQELQASQYFDMVKYINSPAEIEQSFKNGEISMAVVFGDHFGQELYHTGKARVELITDATDPNNATLLTNYATGIISDYQRRLLAESRIPYIISPEVKLLYNPQMKGAYNFVPGVLGMILMLICAMMTAITIVREKETGTMEILLASPVRPILIILAKAVPYFTLSCVNLVSVLLLSVFVLGVPVAGSLFWLFAVSFLFIFVSLALGLLVSTITETQTAAMLVSGMAFMMPVMLLSGMMFPIENMPFFLQWIAQLIPAKWYITAVKKLMIKGLGFSAIITELGVLSFMAVLLITVSLKNFKKRLE